MDGTQLLIFIISHVIFHSFVLTKRGWKVSLRYRCLLFAAGFQFSFLWAAGT
ncbi:hypothetical protein ATPR_0589 [Acetobacter tropicalis NBRC 101654]|uniref:Uncharacterized protein n=1 Tax=Acetobacter tropicalis NBRC 101654 TaxID=749388 RepID=F7VB40_9PROT|nr:hypothetical protein ATPR_0589 [Acetobacter tropicalis NBRC 101654]